MDIYSELLENNTKLSVIGLGYVGLPIAIAFSKKIDVIGFDINSDKIEMYNNGFDPTKEVGNDAVKKSNVIYTNMEKELENALFHIVAVPTPVRMDRTPDLTPLRKASETLGRNLKKGSIVVFESTVYPGVTEEICLPILEKESGLKAGVDFKIGYSPERINPGDTVHKLETIIKVVSAMDEDSLDIISKVYELVVEVGVYRAESIKVAEAAKVIENSQRDINIAFMNELSIIFNKMDIDTQAVLNAAKTKWNFLNFHPGLVGGHCIGVDPYYLTYKAEQLGYHSQIILSGRRINDDMGKYVTENIIKKIIKAGISVQEAKVVILGLTFKENCPDIRNSKVIDIINELKEYGIKSIVADPQASKEETKSYYMINLTNVSDLKDVDVVVLAVSHNEFINLSEEDFDKIFKSDINNERVLIDIRGILDKKKYELLGYNYWRL